MLTAGIKEEAATGTKSLERETAAFDSFRKEREWGASSFCIF